MACLDLLRHFGDSLLVSEALLQLVRMYLLVHGCGISMLQIVVRTRTTMGDRGENPSSSQASQNIQRKTVKTAAN